MQRFLDLLDLVTRLRAPDGCPWDQKQTPQSFKPYLLEEAHELAEAIDHDDPGHIREELGDLLFQAAFLNRLYEEKGHFSMEDVLNGIITKMIRRHPHVFGDSQATSEAALRQQWNEIKAQENAGRDVEPSALSAPPKSLPALRRAQRVSESAAKKGFEWPSLADAFAKLEEEIGECRKAIDQGDSEAIAEEIGDALFVLVNIGRLTSTNTEEALQATIAKFTQRFAAMEAEAASKGTDFSQLDIQTMLNLWQRAKTNSSPRPDTTPR